MHWDYLLLAALPVLAIGVNISLNLYFERRRQTEFFRKRSKAKAVFSPSQRKWLCTQCGQTVTDQEHET